MNEYRAVPGFPGYQVSDGGEVRSSKGRTPRVLKQTVNPQTGYPQVYLRANGKATTWRVHALVLLAFVGPRPSDSDASRHLNGDRLDNRLTNLAYGTRSENMRDAVAHGTHAHARKTHCKHGHSFSLENTYRSPSNPTTRECRTCTYERHRRVKESRAAA